MVGARFLRRNGDARLHWGWWDSQQMPFLRVFSASNSIYDNFSPIGLILSDIDKQE